MPVKTVWSCALHGHWKQCRQSKEVCNTHHRKLILAPCSGFCRLNFWSSTWTSSYWLDLAQLCQVHNFSYSDQSLGCFHCFLLTSACWLPSSEFQYILWTTSADPCTHQGPRLLSLCLNSHSSSHLWEIRVSVFAHYWCPGTQTQVGHQSGWFDLTHPGCSLCRYEE